MGKGPDGVAVKDRAHEAEVQLVSLDEVQEEVVRDGMLLRLAMHVR